MRAEAAVSTSFWKFVFLTEGKKKKKANSYNKTH